MAAPADRTTLDAAFAGDLARPLMALMRSLGMGRGTADPKDPAVALARGLGWLDDSLHLTHDGWIAADPCREFLFWEERGRTIHCWEQLPALTPDAFVGKRVLELGSGVGCNLFSLQALASHVEGIELVPAYVALTPALARIAGIAPPKITISGAEKLPVGDASFDVVLAFGSLQYMRIREVLSETARVLAPGGRVILLFGSFGGYLRGMSKQLPGLVARPREVLRLAKTVANTATYSLLRRRITKEGDPVYPTRATMFRWLRDAGLEPDLAETAETDGETCYVARKA